MNVHVPSPADTGIDPSHPRFIEACNSASTAATMLALLLHMVEDDNPAGIVATALNRIQDLVMNASNIINEANLHGHLEGGR